jgi:hypothetical protein
VVDATAAPALTEIRYEWDLGPGESELIPFVQAFHIYLDGSPTPVVVDKDLRTWTATGLAPGYTYAARITVLMDGEDGDGVTLWATTLANPQPAVYWRFEEGAADAVMAHSAQNTLNVDPVLDGSGNGNEMRTYDANSAPSYRSTTAADRVPFTGAPNTRCLEFTPNRDIYAYNRPLNAQVFDKFTLEASFAPNALNRTQTITGRDGNAANPSPSIRLVQRGDDNRFAIEIVDAAGTMHSLPSVAPATLGQWHHLAATYDGSSLALYLQGPADPAMMLQGTLTTQGGLKDAPGTWTVGRGWWNGSADWADGRIDEVRITPEAITPTHFLMAPTLWDQWRNAHFTAAELLDPAISGEHADPDADDIPNLTEYGLGLSPFQADVNPLLIFNSRTTGLFLNYSLNTAAGDIALSFETSQTMEPGSWQPVAPLADWMLSYAGTRQLRRAQMVSTSAPAAFYRVKVTRTSPPP